MHIYVYITSSYIAYQAYETWKRLFEVSKQHLASFTLLCGFKLFLNLVGNTHILSILFIFICKQDKFLNTYSDDAFFSKHFSLSKNKFRKRRIL